MCLFNRLLTTSLEKHVYFWLLLLLLEIKSINYSFFYCCGVSYYTRTLISFFSPLKLMGICIVFLLEILLNSVLYCTLRYTTMYFIEHLSWWVYAFSSIRHIMKYGWPCIRKAISQNFFIMCLYKLNQFMKFLTMLKACSWPKISIVNLRNILKLKI